MSTDELASWLKSLEPGKYLPCLSLHISEEGEAVELLTDTSLDTTAEWIPGEGADIALLRCRITNAVVGVRLPLRLKNLCVHYQGPIRINAGFRKDDAP